MLFDFIVINDMRAILRRANDCDGCFLHDSRRQVVSDASVADFMLKHVHALGEVVQVDVLATDDTVLLSAN